MTRRTITDAATATLEHWLDQLQQGQLSIGELPLAVEAWLHAGYAFGRESRDAEVAELERTVNRLHNLAFNTDKQQRDAIEVRLAHSLDTASEEVWQRLEQDLRAMREQPNTAQTTPLDDAAALRTEGIQKWNSTRSNSSSSERAA